MLPYYDLTWIVETWLQDVENIIGLVYTELQFFQVVNVLENTKREAAADDCGLAVFAHKKCKQNYLLVKK